MADSSPDSKQNPSLGARFRPYVLPVVSSLMAIVANIVNQKYGTLVEDWLILLIIYMAVGLWFYWAWHTERIGRLRAWLLYTYPRMFLVFLIIGGATIGAAAGAGLWVANRNEQRMKTAPGPTQEQSARAGLVGRIICLNTETPVNTYRDIVVGKYPLDFVVTMNVSVTNDSALAASATRFELSLIFNENAYSCIELPISQDTSFLKHTTRRPGGPGPLKITWEPLRAFPLNTEITNTNHQRGWLKFWTGPIQDFRVDTANIRLVLFDHRNQPNIIYDGPVRQPSVCGTIVEGQTQASLPEWE